MKKKAKKARKTAKHSDPKLPDGDYILTEGGAWFTVGQFAVRIRTHDCGKAIDGVMVDIYKDGAEMERPIDSAQALVSDL